MKKFSIFLLLLISFVLVSCSDNVFVDSDLQTKVKTIMKSTDFVDGDNSAFTRTTLTPTNNGTKFSWSSGDIAGVYSMERGLTNFFIDENSISPDGTSAEFNGSGFSLNPNSTYYAFYPYSPSSLEKEKIRVCYSGQNIYSNGCFKDLGLYDYMWASGYTNASGCVGFDFSHLGCVVDFKLQVPVTSTYRQIRFELEGNSDNTALIKNGVVDITESNPIITQCNTSCTDTIYRVDLNNGEGINVTKDSILHVYMMMAPQDLSKYKMRIRLVDIDDKWYSATINGKNMKAGYTYHYTVGDNSQTGGFTGKGEGLPDDYTYRWISSFKGSTKNYYEDILIEGNYIYVVGNFGLRKIDVSDLYNPQLLIESPVVDVENMKGRSITSDDKYLYVNFRQATGGTTELYKPQISIDFESEIQNQSVNFSNNQTLNSFIKSINTKRDISRIIQAIIFKAYPVSTGYKNAICFKMSGESDLFFFSQIFETKEKALNSLVDNYVNKDGDECKVDWTILDEGSTILSNLKVNTYKEIVTENKGSAILSYETNPCPNKGKICGRFVTSNTGDNYSHIAYKKSASANEGYLSFWINVSNLPSDAIIPILSCNGLERLNLICVPNGEGFQLKLNKSDNTTKTFLKNTWYNIKLEYTESKTSLFYRGQECSSWINLSEKLISNDEYNEISIGLQCSAANADISFDDFYYNDSDIDKVSYVNGKVAIVDKSTLDVKAQLNLDYKCTGIGVKNNLLIVDCLNAINMYDISDPLNPNLVYIYRPDTFKDIQGMDFYENNGRKYVLICFYNTGITIFDITDHKNIFVARRDEFDDYLYNGVKLKKIANNFSCVVDYPYVYMANSAIPYCQPQYPQISGVLMLNISDLNNISKELIVIDPSDISTNQSKNDPCPTRIAKYGNTLYLNNRDKGLAVFELINHKPVYKGLINVPNSCVNAVSVSNQGVIFTGDDDSTSSDCNINIIMIE